MARLLPRGVSENKRNSARHSLRTAACSDVTERTADSLLTGHDISVFWFSSKVEGENKRRKRHINRRQQPIRCRVVSQTKKHRAKFLTLPRSRQSSALVFCFVLFFYQMLKAQIEAFSTLMVCPQSRRQFQFVFRLSSTASLSSPSNHNPSSLLQALACKMSNV